MEEKVGSYGIACEDKEAFDSLTFAADKLGIPWSWYAEYDVMFETREDLFRAEYASKHPVMPTSPPAKLVFAILKDGRLIKNVRILDTGNKEQNIQLAIKESGMTGVTATR